MEKNIKVKRLPHGENITIPKRMTSGASGCDVLAAIDEPLILKPLERALIPTGLSFEIPHGYEIQVRPRSGLAFKHGITVLNTPGTVDSDYRGEVKVLLINLGKEPFTINRGERIAQLVPAEVPMNIDFEEASNLSETKRGAGGFGHTGV